MIYYLRSIFIEYIIIEFDMICIYNIIKNRYFYIFIEMYLTAFKFSRHNVEQTKINNLKFLFEKKIICCLIEKYYSSYLYVLKISFYGRLNLSTMFWSLNPFSSLM